MANGRVRGLLDRWGAAVWVDPLFAVAGALAYFFWRVAGGNPAVSLDPSARGVLFGTLAATAGALLAFGVTPIAIVLALAPGPRLKALLQHHGDELRRTLLAMLWGYLAVMAVAILGLAIDTGAGSARWVRYLLLAATIQALIATARLVRTFGLLLLNIGRDQATDDTPLPRIDRQVG